MTDPYRDSMHPKCPRCTETLEHGPTSLICPREHGEWIRTEALAPLALHANAAPMSTPGLPCVICKRAMMWMRWTDVVFESCANHGIWVNASHRDAFHALTADLPIQHHDAVDLIERLAMDPEGRRELARRLLTLEREVADLKKKLS